MFRIQPICHSVLNSYPTLTCNYVCIGGLSSQINYDLEYISGQVNKIYCPHIIILKFAFYSLTTILETNCL